ncbi:iron ABC transporter permease [Mycoplasmatota bacterium]|nr:iron ABC transporter permease [Mycoplasmatota bacterium]
MSVKRNFNGWFLISLLFVLLIILPTTTILFKVFEQPNDVWFHIKTYLLPEYTQNTLYLISITALLTSIIGVSLAWVISVYDFPLRKMLEWSLILPLSIPPYIAAYTYGGLFSYTGSIQVFFRTNNISVNPKYFDIMTMEGTIFIFTMFMFPYIYIISKSFLEKQSAALIESSRILGRSPFETFIYIGLPILKTSIIGGVILVILEVLNDYGVVKYFGIKTFSTAIFTAWFSFGDVTSAVRLSVLLMMIVGIVLVLERFSRGRTNYSYANTKIRPIKRTRLTGIKALLATSYGLIVLAVGFIIPTLQLFSWGLLTIRKINFTSYLFLSLNTFINALIATIIIVLFALIIGNYSRLFKTRLSKIITRITTLGYSIPGAVIAIAVITSFITVDNNFYPLYKFFNPDTKKLVLTSSLIMLLFAYVIRYMAIGYNSIESGFDKIGNTFHEASRTLGMNRIKTFLKVDIPMLKPSIISSIILVFIDVLKELPLTLILRPFNYNTLATKSYEYANDEMIHEAAIPALMIIMISVLSIYILNKIVGKVGKRVDY